MEKWNDGKSKIPSLAGLIFKIIYSFMYTFYYIFKRNISNIPFPHFPKTHCPIVPLFQHSNWGEAPMFIYPPHDTIDPILFFRYHYRANFKTSPFAQYLRQAQILILEIHNVFLWLKFSSSLILNKIEHFETASVDRIN